MSEEKKMVPTDVLKSVFQIGIVVPDVDEAVENMRKVLGVEPDLVDDFMYPWMTYRGEETGARARVAMYNQFGVQLEIMSPIGEGPTVWGDHLADMPRGGYSLHHIRFNDVPDNDKLSEVFKERGIEVYQEGGSIVNPGAKFTYYDTMKELGFVIEVLTQAK